MIVATISSKSKPTLAPASAGRRTCKQLSLVAAEVARSRALIGSASPSEERAGDRGKRSLAHSAGRQRREFALEVAPPALSANYRLLFSQKLKKVGVLPLPAVESGRNDANPVGEKQTTRDRPASSPSRATLPLDLTSKSLISAIYSGGPVFVEPSPLSKRMPYRGSSSAGGVRRRLSAPKKMQRTHTERLPPTQLLTNASRVRAPSEPKTSMATAAVDNGDPRVDDTTGSDESAGEDGAGEEAVGGGDDDEEESYEDDFDTTGDDSDGDKKMPDRNDRAQVGSDGELIDMLHRMSAESSSALRSTEVEAATAIQRHARGALVRRKCGRLSRNASSKTARHGAGRRTPPVVESGKSERRGSTSKGVKAKRIPLSARAHRQLQAEGRRSMRDITQRGSRAERRVRPGTAVSPSIMTVLRQPSNKSNASAHSSRSTSFQLREGGPNNQLLSPIKSSGVEPEQKAEDAEAVVRERPDPDALKQIQTLYAEGLQRHKDSHLGLAIECYERALATPGGQGFASLHVNLGSALMAQSKFSEALESFEQAKRIQPNNIKASYNYALVLLHLDRPHEAQLLVRPLSLKQLLLVAC
jgi:hypothetical protein